MPQDVKDWAHASERFDSLASFVAQRELSSHNEAQTRFDVIDRMIRDVFGWKHGQINVEESDPKGGRKGFVDYILRSNNNIVVIEAKKTGASFPTPTKKKRLKLSGSILSAGDIGEAISQVEGYGISKQAQVVVVTNGLCWCCHSLVNRQPDSYAYLYFPFSNPADAQQLFELFAEVNVERGSTARITNEIPRTESRLLSVLHDADARVERNNIADHIVPALNNALYADALLNRPEHLEKCFVSTDARTKFDSYLGIHLADLRPDIIKPARRIRKSKKHDQLRELVETVGPDHAPPVTLIIGPVGAGKSTYLKHFEHVSGRSLLSDKNAHWVYIDLEKMGKGGDPRRFIYEELRTYLLSDQAGRTDYKQLVEPAYRSEIAAIARGPLAPIFTDKQEFNKHVADYIGKDFERVEPYVDKLFRHIAGTTLCVVVLDNIDLYEDDDLETRVFAEGLAIAKRLMCHVIVSLRDRTFVRHKTDAAFDAYELRKLWLDPPPFREVLAARLSLSKIILAKKSARVEMSNGMRLMVPDLSVFFDIAQRSILQGDAGAFVEAMAGSNIRKGLGLVTNFLTSGHVQADRALNHYLGGDEGYAFPFHEIFKGTMLGQFRYYKEQRAECINVFDSRLGMLGLRLLRLILLNYLTRQAQEDESPEVAVADCLEMAGYAGASEAQVVKTLNTLAKHGLLRSVTADDVYPDSTVVLTRTGGYYMKVVSRRFQYVEQCILDTAIDDGNLWQQLSDMTIAIAHEANVAMRMERRGKRMEKFFEYLLSIEDKLVSEIPNGDGLRSIAEIRLGALAEADIALRAAQMKPHEMRRD